MNSLLARLLAPLAVFLLREQSVGHILARPLTEQEEDNQAVRERLLLTEQARRNSHFSEWLATADNRTS